MAQRRFSTPAHSFGTTLPGFARLFISGSLDVTPTTSFRLLQKEFNHDVALIDVYGAKTDSARFDTGTPISVDFGSAGRNIESFYGYINHLEPDIHRLETDPRRRVTRVVAVGTSWVMKEPIQGSFAGRTTTSIMREVAESFKLTTDIQESDIVWQSLTSPSQTSWQFLTALAQRSGYTLFVNKTELRSFDQLDQLRRRAGTTPIFYGPDSPQASTTLDNFKVVSGETTPDGGERAIRLGYGVDPRTGEVFEVKDDASDLQRHRLGRETTTPIFQKVMKDLVLTDRASGADRLGAETMANRFHIQATATLLGNVNVTQGSIITVLGVGDRHSGYWYVQEVEHCIDSQHYELQVVLGRDSIGQVGDEAAQSGRRVVRERLDPFDRRVAVPPPTLLVNGAWRSAYAAKRQAV